MMRSLKIWSMAMVTWIVAMGLSACGGSAGDRVEKGSKGASIVGVWYLKSEMWFTDETRKAVRSERSYPDYCTKRIWMFDERGDSILFAATEGHELNKEKQALKENGTNDYQYGSDRMVVKSVTDRELVVRYYHDYYNEGEQKECGVMVFMK